MMLGRSHWEKHRYRLQPSLSTTRWLLSTFFSDNDDRANNFGRTSWVCAFVIYTGRSCAYNFVRAIGRAHYFVM